VGNARKKLVSSSLLPISGFSALMRNSKYLRPKIDIFRVHHRKGKAVEVVKPQPTGSMRATLLIFDQQLDDPFKL